MMRKGPGFWAGARTGRRPEGGPLAAGIAVGHVLASAATLEDAAPEILRQVCEVLGWAGGELWMVDAAAGLLRRASHWDAEEEGSEETKALGRSLTMSKGEGVPGKIWAAGVPFLGDISAVRDGLRGATGVREGFQSVFGFPLSAGPEVLGVMLFGGKTPREHDAGLLETFDLVGNQVGQFIQRKRAEAATRERESRLAAFAAATFEGIAISEEGRIVDCNEQYAAMLGFTVEELRGTAMSDLFFYEDRALVLGNILEGRESHLEHAVRRKDGTRLIVEARGRPIVTGGLRRVSAVRDVTVRRETEEAVKTALRRFYLVLANMPSGVLMVTEDGLVEFANQSFCDIFGLKENPTELKSVASQEILQKIRGSYSRPEEALARIRELVEQGEAVKGEDVPMRNNRTVLRDFLPIRLGNRDLGRLWIHRDITERKRAEVALRESEERFRAMAETVPSMLFTADPAGSLNYLSQAAYDYSGRSPADMLDEGYLRIVHPDDVEGMERKVAECIRTGTALDAAVRLRGSDLSYRWFHVRTRPVHGPGGRVLRWVGAASDIHDSHEAQVALREAREAAEGASRAKSEFLANMSHEIRTPMNGVIGTAQLLLDSGLSPRQRQLAEIIRHSGDVLLQIVNQVLDFSKIEAGRVELEIGECDVRAVVGAAMEIAAPLVGEKPVGLGYEVGADVPGLVCADAGRLRQILLNLLANGIKFTEAGEVVVRVSLESRTDDGVRLRFAVTDTGIGIPAKEVGRLFQSFTQVHVPGSGIVGGTGLGLAISRRLAEMMGGEIEVESEEGRGSTFSLTVVLGAVEESRAAAPAASGEPGRRRIPVVSGKDSGEDEKPSGIGSFPPGRIGDFRVLVADDNAINRRVLVMMLGELGIDADAVPDGREALTALEGIPYDLVLMDLRMPEMDGRAASAEIRRREGSGRHVTIVAVTASALAGDREECLASGMDDFLAKPVTPAALAALAARWLPGKSAPVADERVGKSGAAIPDAAVNLDALTRLVGGDRGQLRVLTDLFLAQGGERLLALEAALERGDLAVVREEAHALKGSCGTFGAGALASASARMQQAAAGGDPREVAAVAREMADAFEALRRHLSESVFPET